jgi:hypothetical protein
MVWPTSQQAHTIVPVFAQARPVDWQSLSDPQEKLRTEQANSTKLNTTRETFMVFLAEWLMVRAGIMVRADHQVKIMPLLAM